MSKQLICLSIVALFCNVANADERMVGKWKVVSITYLGNPIPQEQVGYTKMEVKSDAENKKFWAETTYQGETKYSDMEFPSKQVQKAKPAPIFMTPRKSKDTPGTVKLAGIYKFSKDRQTLELIFGRNGEAAPKDFNAPGLQFKYERIKEKAAE